MFLNLNQKFSLSIKNYTSNSYDFMPENAYNVTGGLSDSLSNQTQAWSPVTRCQISNLNICMAPVM